MTASTLRSPNSERRSEISKGCDWRSRQPNPNWENPGWTRFYSKPDLIAADAIEGRERLYDLIRAGRASPEADE